jgi:hypothetical protein
MRTNLLRHKHSRLFIGGAILCAAGSAYALYGGGLVFRNENDGYLGTESVLNTWFLDEPCFTDKPIQRNEYPDIDEVEFVVDVLGVEEDTDPKTFVRCRQIQRNQMTCELGTSDGTVASCVDATAPSQLPEPGDVVRLLFDLIAPSICDVVVERNYDVIDPKCRGPVGSGGASGSGGSPSSGGSSGSGGSGGSATCNASNAQATLTTGQSTTIASNACVRLKNESAWSTVDPKLQALPGTATYPVPFSYTWCSGSSSGSLAGNYANTFLINGPGSAANYSCDIFVKLGGNGSQVQFQYFQ